MSALLVAVAEAARAYCEIVQETTAIPAEMVTGGLWANRMVALRERRELAYVDLVRALLAAGYPPETERGGSAMSDEPAPIERGGQQRCMRTPGLKRPS